MTAPDLLLAAVIVAVVIELGAVLWRVGVGVLKSPAASAAKRGEQNGRTV